MHVIIIFLSYYDAHALLPSFAQEFRSNDFIDRDLKSDPLAADIDRYADVAG